MEITNEELIKKAQSLANRRKQPNGSEFAYCGTALLSDSGEVYLGVSIDTPSGLGFCSEQTAISAMITKGESKIKKIVAVLEDGTILPPCGSCREFIYQVNKDNLETEVIIAKDNIVKLKELLPYPWDENL
jgi:cytidine deaminase